MNATELQLGTWLSFGSPSIAELVALCGFDWALLDLEHGCESEAALPGQMRALRHSQTKAIVRVGALNQDVIGRVLDWGAHGIMVPHVNTVQDAFQCVRAANYPPLGRRGYSRTVAACEYGLQSPEEKTTGPVVIAQIESLEAVEHADEIAAVSGIHALFVGPTDLHFDLQVHHSARTYEECLRRVVKAAKEHRKAAGILARDAAEVASLRALGFNWLALDSDVSLLRKSYQNLLSLAEAH
jgi:2-keto-3-deoxy-L-rhamnonate aldolase RhmA